MPRSQAQIDSAKKNLIPLNTRTKEEHSEIASKGGQRTAADSVKIAIANQLRSLKIQNDWTDEQSDWFAATLSDPSANMLKMEKVLLEAKNGGQITSEKYLQIADRMHRTRFGEKQHNTNVNVNLSAEEFEKRLLNID